jgi:hypothetical protein
MSAATSTPTDTPCCSTSALTTASTLVPTQRRATRAPATFQSVTTGRRVRRGRSLRRHMNGLLTSVAAAQRGRTCGTAYSVGVEGRSVLPEVRRGRLSESPRRMSNASGTRSSEIAASSRYGTPGSGPSASYEERGETQDGRHPGSQVTGKRRGLVRSKDSNSRPSAWQAGQNCAAFALCPCKSARFNAPTMRPYAPRFVGFRRGSVHQLSTETRGRSDPRRLAPRRTRPLSGPRAG